ncbi:hypothetical protein ACWEPB_22095 [Kitasatospora cineracea]
MGSMDYGTVGEGEEIPDGSEDPTVGVLIRFASDALGKAIVEAISQRWETTARTVASANSNPSDTTTNRSLLVHTDRVLSSGPFDPAPPSSGTATVTIAIDGNPARNVAQGRVVQHLKTLFTCTERNDNTVDPLDTVLLVQP